MHSVLQWRVSGFIMLSEAESTSRNQASRDVLLDSDF